MPHIEFVYARLLAEKELIDDLTQVTILVDFSQKALSVPSRRIAARTEAL
jgi:hypothetical protein